jgi:hypothetical protein
MRKVAHIAMWRNTVVMAIRDTPATGTVAMDMDIVAMGIVAMGIVATMAILIMEGTTEGTTTPTTGLITEAIMDTRMVATTADISEDSGFASVSETGEECGSKRAEAEAPAICRF